MLVWQREHKNSRNADNWHSRTWVFQVMFLLTILYFLEVMAAYIFFNKVLYLCLIHCFFSLYKNWTRGISVFAYFVGALYVWLIPGLLYLINFLSSWRLSCEYHKKHIFFFSKSYKRKDGSEKLAKEEQVRMSGDLSTLVWKIRTSLLASSSVSQLR